MKYTKQYFIDKFQAIPEEFWIKGNLNITGECHCALGHCGVYNLTELNEEANALSNLLKPVYNSQGMFERTRAEVVFGINDYCDNLGYTPKQRILNALNLVPDETP